MNQIHTTLTHTKRPIPVWGTLLLALLLALSCSAEESLVNSIHIDPLAEARATVALATNETDSPPLTNWVLRRSDQLARHIPNVTERLTLLKNVQWQALRNHIDADLILALIEVESSYKPSAISNAGARGLMQVMPFWIRSIGKPGDDLFDIRTNIAYGSAILRHYLDIENNNQTRALARYNGSQGKTWYPERIFNAHSRGWEHMPGTQVDQLVSNQLPKLSLEGKCGNAPGFQICWD